MDRVDAVVIGAGVVGLAVARALALRGLETVVLEAETAIGTGTSSRNSEVIHAGLYYPQGSWKARLCVQGRQMLYRYAEERGIAYRRCGKLVVATSKAQLPALRQVIEAAGRNGVTDLQWLEADAAHALEPALSCVAAVLSPSTGIIDSHGYMLALQGDLEAAGGMIAFASPVERVRAFVVPHRPQWCAVGGEVLSEGGSGLAYFTAIVLTGRPADQHEQLLAGFTDLLVRVAGVPREQVRGLIEQVRPEDWGIGGAPAAQVRADEIAARAR